MLREALFRGGAPEPARSSKHELLSELLAEADILLDGPSVWDMQTASPTLATRLFAQGSLGLGESYMDAEWEAERLDEFFARLLRARLGDKVSLPSS
jgi:cyclopropane-fatty-acyl-phospholipid synthase